MNLGGYRLDVTVEKIADAMPSNLSRDFRKSIAVALISVLVGASLVGANNYITPDNPKDVGYTEVETYCAGIDAGFCLGIQRQTYTTHEYDQLTSNFTFPEEGTPNYYRRIESELMLRAYNTCNSEMEGYDWTSEVEYRGKTATEWREDDNIQLLPCEKTFYRRMNASS